jgi:hypothetical protein
VRVRTTVVLAVLALAATGLWVATERSRLAREAAGAAERRVVGFDPAAVREIVVDKPGERVVIRAEGGRWRIVAPEDAPADGPTVEGLLAFVRRLEKVRTLDGDGDLAELGLAAPPLRLDIALTGGRTLSVLLAHPNPAHTGVYAKLADAPVVFLAPVELARELAKSPYVEEVRDRTLLPVDSARVLRLEIERAGVRIAVARAGEHRWRVERPFVGPGDDGIVRDLLWKIGAARWRHVADGPGRPDFARPHARLSIAEEGGPARTLTVVLDEASPHRLYATVDGVPGVRVVDAQLLTDLALDPDTLRDRQLLALAPGEVERIAIRYPGERLVLERAGAGWRVLEPEPGEAVPAVVENLLEILPNLRYTGIAADAAPDLARFGLDRPRLTVTVRLRGGRSLPVLAVGARAGASHFVMVADRRAVYKVDSRLIRVIPDDPRDALRAPLPERLKREYDRQQRAGRTMREGGAR